MTAKTKQPAKKNTPVTKARPARIVREETVIEKIEDVIVPHKMLNLKPYVFGLILVITGIIGIFTSFELTVDKIHVLKDPTFQPVCNINPVFSCKSVMTSSQAELFGVPNTVFGLIGFSAVATIGVAMMFGARMNKLFWRFWMAGMVGGLAFMLYLMFQSIYRLGTLCLFCMTTWAALIPLIWYSLLWSLQHGYIPTPPKLESVVRFIRREHLSLMIVVYLVVIGLIVNHFWYYFKTL